jgi:hypothetical protein
VTYDGRHVTLADVLSSEVCKEINREKGSLQAGLL